MTYRNGGNRCSPRAGVTIAITGWLALNPGAASAVSGEPNSPAPAALSVASDPPGATVYVDGQFAGHTPVNVTKLSTGDHRVRLVKDGYLENGRVVTISRDRINNVQVTLTRRSGSNAEAAAQVSSAGGSGGGSSKKWIYIGAAAGGGAAAAVLVARRNKPPVAGTISVDPTAIGMANVTPFAFRSTGASDPDGDQLSYDWDFGDNTTHGSGANPTHVYPSTGTFSVTLSVSDGKLSVSAPSLSVTVAPSVAGNWSGARELGLGSNVSVNLIQNGGALTGALTQSGSPVPSANQTINGVTGTVSPLTHPSSVAFTTPNYTVVGFPGVFTIRFSGTTETSGTTMNGTLIISSSVLQPPSFSSTVTFRK